MTYSREELNEAYRKLPEELKEVFLSVDVTEAISNIGKKYSLHIDQIGLLDSETGLVLLGLTHPTDFVNSMTKRLGIDRVIASQIASEINDQVLLKVREAIKDMHQKRQEQSMNVPPEVEINPTKDALLAAIENPEGLPKKPVPEVKNQEIPLVEVKNPYTQQTKPETPLVAVPPKMVEKKEENIIEQKMASPASAPKVERKVDPYRELPI